MMISHGVKISITECGGEIVPDTMSWSVSFLFFFFFVLYHVFMVKVQELAFSASYGVQETLIPNNCPLYFLIGKIQHPESLGKIPFPYHLRQ